MAATALIVDSDWERGQIRDAPRGSIPEGGVYNGVDYLFHRPGMAMKRGGSSYVGMTMTGASYGTAVAYAEFSSGGQLLGVGSNGHLYRSNVGDIDSSAANPIDTPKLRVGAGKEILVFPRQDGTSAPRILLTGNTVRDLGGSPPAGKFAAVYKSRLVLGGSSANPGRLFFSPVPDIESTWDTTNSWVDTDYPVTGLAALQNALIVFSGRHTQRITGTTPPPGEDMDRAPVGDIGCTDARSIVVFEGNAIFANSRGVYTTNGSSFQNLTALAGNESYWQSLFSGYDATSWSIASGILGGYLIVCILNGSRDPVDTLMFNLRRPAWWRLSNVKAMMFASAVGVSEELYYADAKTNRFVALSGIFSPAAGNKNDADGTAVAPILETRLLGGGPTLKHFGHARVSMDMRDAASDNPTMAVSVAPGLEATTFAAVRESPLAEKTDSNRYRFSVNKVSQGVTLRFTQTNASAKTEIYAIELDTRALPITAGGQ